jgi:hypothetical protein
VDRHAVRCGHDDASRDRFSSATKYFDLLALDPAVGEFLALGEQVLFVWDGTAYQFNAEQ